MTPEIRRRIHAFRNALVPAADTRSNECFRMGRWQELNAFPHGCCAGQQLSGAVPPGR
ncbi:TPA: hypothetical protein O7142_003945 [Salmonella enterica]|nr:hypothetical protein [Salmonella enterica subsp. diarizonae]HDC2661431.1 hypothetical protein [Salmonella enterica]